MSLFLCLAAFTICFLAGRRSLVAGLTATFGVGYAYGIVRANLPETFSHFIFDAAVIGLYAAQLFRTLSPAQRFRTERLKPWMEVLIAWPVLLFFLPVQDFLIQFVGLRGSIFLLPFLLLGARMEAEEKYNLALWVARLNLVVFGLAVAEFFLGVETFFPQNEVTKLIYLSNDAAGLSTTYRIPSSFVTAHAYAGTMVMSLPLLFGALVQKYKRGGETPLLILALAASLLGILMSGARMHFIIGFILILVATFSLRSRVGYAIGWLILLCAIGWLASGEARLQRFMTLQDTDMVSERIAGSVNMNFFELAAQYPFGNGLGGGGTSIPYFLKDHIENPVGMENEYARIMLEQGIPGLVLWIAFIVWLLTRYSTTSFEPRYLSRRLAWVACAAYFTTGLIGTGIFTTVPQTCLFLLSVGWIAAREPLAAENYSVALQPLQTQDQITALP